MVLINNLFFIFEVWLFWCSRASLMVGSVYPWGWYASRLCLVFRLSLYGVGYDYFPHCFQICWYDIVWKGFRSVVLTMLVCLLHFAFCPFCFLFFLLPWGSCLFLDFSISCLFLACMQLNLFLQFEFAQDFAL